MIITFLSFFFFFIFLLEETPFDDNLYPYGKGQNDDELSTESSCSIDNRCHRISAGRFGFPFFQARHFKLHVSINVQPSFAVLENGKVIIIWHLF